MLNPVGWFEIYVQDMARAQGFYERLLGFTFDHVEMQDDKSAVLIFPGDHERYGTSGALIKNPARGPSDLGTLVYFTCDDCAVCARIAADHGGRILREKYSIGKHGFIAIIRDSEGNMIGLHSFK